MIWQAADALRFRLAGGYVSVPDGPAGSPYPPLASPAAVQEILGAAELGPLSPYPRPPGLSRPIARLLEAYLQHHRIRTVVFWPTGVDPALARQLFTDALGTPTRRLGGVLIWSLPAAGPPGTSPGRGRPGLGPIAGVVTHHGRLYSDGSVQAARMRRGQWQKLV
jgi:hypothetical protein